MPRVIDSIDRTNCTTCATHGGQQLPCMNRTAGCCTLHSDLRLLLFPAPVFTDQGDTVPAKPWLRRCPCQAGQAAICDGLAA